MYVPGNVLFREVYAFYSPSYAGPYGNIANCFHVNDTGEDPVVRGVPIPKKIGDADQYTVRKEIEIDFSQATPRQFHGILGKSILLVGMNTTNGY